MDKYQLWQAVLGELELGISRANFKTWLQNTQISRLEEDDKTVVVSVPNNFSKNWLEKKYHKAILSALRNATEDKVQKVFYEVEVAFPVKAVSPISVRVDELASKKPATNSFGLNPRYTFETFVVGTGNELAHAACVAVSRKPGGKYNPLFIYGGVGLGKTHLLQAIGHAILKKSPKIKVLYTNAEKFTNEFITAIRGSSLEKFKKTYRNMDVLLMDDIQFMTGKERTEEEFFHTFNSLYQNQSQIVISSDRPPKAIPTLQDRMISRFEMGLIADIKPPDIETRLVILQVKCQEKGCQLSQEILQYLAAHIQSNVRELEGALNRLIAYYELRKAPLGLDEVKNILASLTSQPRKSMVSVKQLIETVASFYNIKASEMISASRKRELVGPRQVTTYLLREEIHASFPLIGEELGGRDHTTAMHSYQKVKKAIEEEGRIKQEIDMIKQRLYNQ